MFKKLRNVIANKDTNVEEPSTDKLEPMLLPNHDRRINYDPKVNSSNTDANLKKGNIQFEQLQIADGFINIGKIEEGLGLYKRIILEDGLAINSQSAIMDYLNHLYKLERNDEAWGLVNEFTLKYPSLEKKYQEFRVKILKKEKKYRGALYHQLMSIIFHNIHFREMPVDSYRNKYVVILKSLRQVDKQNDVQELINKYSISRRYDRRAIRDELAEIISSE